MSNRSIRKLLSAVFLCVSLYFSLANTIVHANDNPTDKTQSLSFYFQNIEVRSLLQLIARNSGLNFIIGDSVKGSMTLDLKNVTWQEALHIILKTQGLTSRRIGNVIYISTIENIEGTESKEFQSEETIANLMPLQSSVIHLHYANAQMLSKLLKSNDGSLLTTRGQIAIDPRTNTLIIRDTPKNLAILLPEIRKLDIPAKQVQIEARIVNVDKTVEEALGARFGLTGFNHLSGTLNGANEIASGTSPGSVKSYTDRLNFNLPASTLFDGANPGSIGLALARLGPVLLDLELSALEGEKLAQVIARPRVITSNQQKAMIETGEEIPYQEASSSGATTVTFKKAVLSLEIIPQITRDNKIVLNLRVTEDTRGSDVNIGTQATTGSGGSTNPVSIPAINTQQVQSSVLLNNNETIVLGGVFKTDEHHTLDRIPFFGDLPVIGHLFRYTDDYSKNSELLVFITPKIVSGQPESRYAHIPIQAPWKGEKPS